MDDLDSLLEEGRNHTKRIVLLVAIGCAAILLISGFYLLQHPLTGIAPEPLPPFHPEISTASPSSTISEKINLNTADKEAIMSLPTIGEIRANQIIEHRPYTSIEDLERDAKVPTSVIEKIKEYVSF